MSNLPSPLGRRKDMRPKGHESGSYLLRAPSMVHLTLALQVHTNFEVMSVQSKYMLTSLKKKLPLNFAGRMHLQNR